MTKQNNAIIGLMAIVAVLGFTIAVDQTSVSAQERTLRQLDVALTTLENDFVGNLTRIDSLEDSRQDYNPIINQYDVTVDVPHSGVNAITPTSIFLTCGGDQSAGDTEIPIGFSWELDSPNDASDLFISQLSMGVDSPFFNELFIQFVNSSEPKRTITVEVFVQCAIIDVIS